MNKNVSTVKKRGPNLDNLVPVESSLTWESNQSQQILVLQAENCQLREHLLDCKNEIVELQNWKNRSIDRMALLAPKRDKIMKAKYSNLAMKKKLAKLRKDLGARLELEQKLEELQEKDTELMASASDLLKENDLFYEQIQNEKADHMNTKKHFSELQQSFQALLGRLNSLRRNIQSSIPNLECIPEDDLDQNIPLIEKKFDLSNPEEVSEKVLEMMASALEIIQWFEFEYADSSNFSKCLKDDLKNEQSKCSQLSTEITELKSTLKKLQQDYQVEKGVVVGLEKIQLQKDDVINNLNVELQKIKKFKTEGKSNTQRLLKEMRQYVNLTQQEVRKKFGYIPESISHPELWEKLVLASNDIEIFFKD